MELDWWHWVFFGGSSTLQLRVTVFPSVNPVTLRHSVISVPESARLLTRPGRIEDPDGLSASHLLEAMSYDPCSDPGGGGKW